MNGTRVIHESGSFVAEGVKAGGKRKAVLITPGKGSSGYYAESVLAEHGPKAFPRGTKMWFNHPASGNPADRDPRDQWGYLAEDAHYEPGTGLVGKVEVLPHAREIIESLGTQASLSIWAMGDSDDAGNITQLLPHVTNSVDIVAYPGREGSGLTEQMLESFRLAAEQQPGAASAQDTPQKKETMEKQEMKELIESILDAKLAPVLTFVNESKEAIKAAAKAEAQAEADGAAVQAAVESFRTKVEAISAAELPKEISESLIEAAVKGEDVESRIADIKRIGEAFKEQFSESADTGEGVVYGGRISESDSFEISGWVK